MLTLHGCPIHPNLHKIVLADGTIRGFWCKPRMLSKYTQKYESNYKCSIFTKYKNTDFYIDFRTTHSLENITFILDYLRNHFCTRTKNKPKELNNSSGLFLKLGSYILSFYK